MFWDLSIPLPRVKRRFLKKKKKNEFVSLDFILEQIIDTSQRMYSTFYERRTIRRKRKTGSIMKKNLF